MLILKTVKRYALNILERAIKTRWNILPREQCEAIKDYIVKLIIRLSSNPEDLSREDLILKKLDVVLVQVSLEDNAFIYCVRSLKRNGQETGTPLFPKL